MSRTAPTLEPGACRAGGWRPPLLALAAALLLAAPAAGHPDDYTFQRVADSADGFATFGEPAINDDSRVAFQARLDDPALTRGIYVGAANGSDLTLVAAQSGPLDYVHERLALGRNDRVALLGRFDTGEEAILSGPLRRDVLFDTRGDYDDFIDLHASPEDELLFFASRDDGIRGIYDGPDPRLDAVVEEGSDFTSIRGFAFAGGTRSSSTPPSRRARRASSAARIPSPTV